MSIPPMDYTIPPPRLDMPPPVSLPSRIAPPVFPHPMFIPPPPLPSHGNTPRPPPPFVPMTSFPPMNVPPPPTYPIDIHSVPPPFYTMSQSYSGMIQNDSEMEQTSSYSKYWPDPLSGVRKSKSSVSNPRRDSRALRDSVNRYHHGRIGKESYSQDPSSYKDCEKEREMRYRDRRYSRSPSYHSHRSRSPLHSNSRDRERRYNRDRFDERREYERKRCEYERSRSSSSIRDCRNQSRSRNSHYDRRLLRSPSSQSYRSSSRVSDTSRSQTQDMPYNSREESASRPMTDREKILAEYRYVNG